MEVDYVKCSWRYYSVRKVSDLFLFCENLVDLNEARLYKATMNLYTHASIFTRLSIASVDGKQHLSELVLSALVGFSLLGKYLNTETYKILL